MTALQRTELPARWLVVAPLALLGIALLLRIIDIYVLCLDERIGEIILSKALGFALAVGYTWWGGQRLSAIGLHTVQVQTAGGELQPALVMSVVVVVALSLLAFTVKPLARRLGLPHLRPWGAGNETGAHT